MEEKVPEIYIGTSGYNYSHWKGKFYPEGLPSRQWLNFYSSNFSTVELNVTFYRLPLAKTFANWKHSTPPGFTFAVKGNRLITHTKRLKDVREALARFFERAKELEEKLGVVLWQLPPSFREDRETLEQFCLLLQEDPVSRRTRHVFEFRHNSWCQPQVYKILEEHNIALCIADAPRWPRTEEVTADFVYIRFHGSQKLYTSSYTSEELKEWARKICHWFEQGKDIYAYFNNDAGGYAVANAGELLSLTRKLIQPHSLSSFHQPKDQ